jgi:hypothetical protein
MPRFWLSGTNYVSIIIASFDSQILNSTSDKHSYLYVDNTTAATNY